MWMPQEDGDHRDGPPGRGPLVVAAPMGEDDAWYVTYVTQGATGRRPVPWPAGEDLATVVEREQERRRRNHGDEGEVTGVLVLLGTSTPHPLHLPECALVARLEPDPTPTRTRVEGPGSKRREAEIPRDSCGIPVLCLPRDVEHLVSLLLRCEFPPRARILCLTGARGGLGTTTLAGALARTLAASGTEVALVDLDPAGGLGLVLGAESRSGLRWADLPQDEDTFHPLRLQGALPHWHRVPFLTGDGRGRVPRGAAAGPVLRALAGANDLVVVDLPRGQAPPAGAQVLLVAGLDVRSAVGAEALATELAIRADGTGQVGTAGVPGLAGIVVRTVGEDVTVEDLEAMTHATCLAQLGTDRAVARRCSRGEDPTEARGVLRQAAAALARHLGPET